jgi:Protein of unknown function (DUF642)
MRAIIRVAAVTAAAAAVLAAITLPASAAGTNLIKNGGFEKPKLGVPQQSFSALHDFGKCVSGSHNCWHLGIGTVDLVSKSVWDPKAGKQSIDLNSGAEAAEFAQAIFAAPGSTYKVTFWLAATPGAPDNVALAVFWGNIDEHGNLISTHEHDYNFFPIGHTATSMGWTKETFVETADPASSEVRLYFQSTTNLGPTNDDYGPVIDAVSVKPS